MVRLIRNVRQTRARLRLSQMTRRRSYNIYCLVIYLFKIVFSIELYFDFIVQNFPFNFQSSSSPRGWNYWHEECEILALSIAVWMIVSRVIVKSYIIGLAIFPLLIGAVFVFNNHLYLQPFFVFSLLSIAMLILWIILLPFVVHILSLGANTDNWEMTVIARNGLMVLSFFLLQANTVPACQFILCLYAVLLFYGKKNNNREIKSMAVLIVITFLGGFYNQFIN